jgi:hypothetical protein
MTRGEEGVTCLPGGTVGFDDALGLGGGKEVVVKCGHPQWRMAAQRDGRGGNILRDSMLIGLSIRVMAGCRFLRGKNKQSAPARNIYGVSRAQSKAHFCVGRQIRHHLEASFTVRSARIQTDPVKRLQTTGTTRAKGPKIATTEDLLAAAVPGPEAAGSQASRQKSGKIDNLAGEGSELVETALPLALAPTPHHEVMHRPGPLANITIQPWVERRQRPDSSPLLRQHAKLHGPRWHECP